MLVSLDDRVNPSYSFFMRPLYHPSLDEITVQGILYALSDPARVRILVELIDADCAKNCSAFLHIDKRPLPKSTVSQHFRILRESGLIRSLRKGTELQNQTRCAELKRRFGPMIAAILEAFHDEARRHK
ncbi:MAG TPA: ArsR family transcriptional regulator [Pirellulales bacterium]|nr:ArsR family transcriptional regulator [Pirellulales bacterium]